MCVISIVYSESSVKKSQSNYSGRIRTHDLCNSSQYTKLDHRDCPVARGSSNPAGTANDLDAICFSADKLKEVLTANKGDKGTMHISSNGLARIDFTGTDFESNYWLVQLQN